MREGTYATQASRDSSVGQFGGVRLEDLTLARNAGQPLSDHSKRRVRKGAKRRVHQNGLGSSDVPLSAAQDERFSSRSRSPAMAAT